MSSHDEHAEIAELCGLAALGALPSEDEPRLVGHLRTCAACRATFAEQRAVATLLLDVPDPIAPPPELKDRILAAIAAENEAAETKGRGDTEQGHHSPSPRVSASPPPRRQRWFDWRDLGMAAALAAALYFGYWTLRLQGNVAASQARLAQQEALVRAATQGRVVQMAATNVAPQVRGAVAEAPGGTVVYLDNLPQPAPDRAYEVWLIPPGGQPIGVGLSSAGQGGTQAITIDRGLAGIQTVAVTEEPAGGSPAPTSQIVAAAGV